ncbi:MAG: hypothetical protein JXR58_00445 [Bacteroidales bacterium]|nr:hypothetical protein [Bacteroidales bacterium]
MYSYLTTELLNNKPPLITFSTTQDYNFKSSDAINHYAMVSQLFASNVKSIHHYGVQRNTNYDDVYDAIGSYHVLIPPYSNPVYPVIVSEFGVLQACLEQFDHNTIHDKMWATSLMGSAGVLPYWWEAFHNKRIRYGELEILSGYNKMNQFYPLSKFMNYIDFENNSFTRQQWSDKNNHENCKIENFALKNNNKELVYGWVNNLTIWWRSLAKNNNDCIKAMDTESTLPDCPCEVDDLTKPEKNIVFSDCPPNNNPQTLTNEKVTIKGLKSSFLWSKQRYWTHWYNTSTGAFSSHSVDNTNMWGRLKPTIPTMNVNNSDWAY